MARDCDTICSIGEYNTHYIETKLFKTFSPHGYNLTYIQFCFIVLPRGVAARVGDNKAATNRGGSTVI